MTSDAQSPIDGPMGAQTTPLGDDPVAAVIGRLTGVSKSGDQWKALCPAHDDSLPSLSVGRGDDGRALLKCHAGCSQDSVLAALQARGVGKRDLFPPPAPWGEWNGKASGTSYQPTGRLLATREFTYVDVTGCPVGRAVRREYESPDGGKPNKRIHQERADGRGGWEKGGIPHGVPYNLPAARVKAAVGGVVFVVEGEPKVDALTARGLTATCNPGGAGKWTREHAEHLRGSHVVVLPDNDDPGRSHGEYVARLCAAAGAADVRIVDLPGLPDKGDVVDWLSTGERGRSELEALVRDAAPWSPSLACDGDSRSRVRTLAEIMANPESLKPPQAVVPRLAYRGRVTLLAAREKSGKSTVVTAGTAAATCAGHFLGEAAPASSVLWAMLEEHEGDLARRAKDLGVDPDRVYVLTPAELPNGIVDIAEVAEGLRPDLVVIDTLSALADTARIREAGDSTAWTPLMRSITAIARTTNAAVLLLHHARRSDGEYRDSSAIGANVDLLIEIENGPADDPTLRKFKPKARWQASPFSVRFDGSQYALVTLDLLPAEKILRFITEHPGCSRNSATEAAGLAREAALREIDRLIYNGVLEDRKAGKTSRLYAVAGGADGRAQVVPELPLDEEPRTTSRTTSQSVVLAGCAPENHSGTTPEPVTEPGWFSAADPISRDENHLDLKDQGEAWEEGEL